MEEGNISIMVLQYSLLYLSASINSGDGRVKGEIHLSINRASVSSSNCFFPTCDEISNLHRVPLKMRHHFMQFFRYYIPQRSQTCDHHKNESNWDVLHIESIDKPFTVARIEDMVDLLRIESKPLTCSGDLEDIHIGANFCAFI